MANFKCKMCGAQLEVKEGQTVAVCSFCGSKQTVANADDERKENLFNRANALRINCEFDKALLAYQSIISIFPTEPEAYWGIVLCKYGIEYVDDPRIKNKKPTIHRASFDPILRDSDYLSALAYSDVIAKEVYQEQAKEISNIQKNILSISQKEEPFDIFICYKETDENGKRTSDSVMAQEIYDELIDKGYKVFFSRITLENKLGSMYEPYIFAALNSAKIMLVIGTKVEYFNAIWVKNEWSRFIDLMATRPDHYLIPCYKNMDAYEMPEQFLSFQAQNLSKLGFMQDLLRGIDKLMDKEEFVKEKVIIQSNDNVNTNNVNVTALLKRVDILLGDQDYEKADSLLETVLNNDPTNYKAYLYKLAIELKLTSLSAFKDLEKPFDQYPNYQKAYRFADEKEKQKLDEINTNIKSVAYEKQYQEALSLKEKRQYINAIAIFESLEDYKDSTAQADNCQYLALKEKYDRAIKAKEEKKYFKAKAIFGELNDFEDSKEQIKECDELEIIDKKEEIYQKAKFEKVDGLISAYIYRNYVKFILPNLQRIPGYKDTDELIAYCNAKISEYDNEQKRLAKVRKEQLKIKKKKARIVGLIASGSVLTIVATLLLTFLCFVPAGRENKIISYLNNKQYDKAYKLIKENGSFGKTKKLYQMYLAGKAFEATEYSDAINTIVGINGNFNVKYDLNGGIATKTSETTKSGCFQNIPTKSGYAFAGWRLTDYSLKSGSYTANISLIAEYVGSSYASALGLTPIIDSSNQTVTYGLYPQTHVTFTSSNSNPRNGIRMINGWYLYNNAYYAQLTANPYTSGYTFDDDTVIKSDTYWFKCEPITWTILKTSNNEYTLLSSVLLDAYCYYNSTSIRTIDGKTVYPNNYKYSDIRTSLNGDFYNSAFALNNSYIQTSTVNNAASTTYSSSNSYACENTNDKVYLLSYKDYKNTSYGFTSSTSSTTTRQCKTTDFARANGAYCSTGSSYKYNGWYWTRSPISDYSISASYVNYDGDLGYSDCVYYTNACVRPSLLIKVA